MGIGVGDVITVQYETYNPVATTQEFELLVGEQSAFTSEIIHTYAE